MSTKQRYDIITRCLLSQGIDLETSKRAAEAVMHVEIASDMRASTWDQDAAIYEMRATLSCSQVATRLGINERSVRRAVKRHHERLRGMMAA